MIGGSESLNLAGCAVAHSINLRTWQAYYIKKKTEKQKQIEEKEKRAKERQAKKILKERNLKDKQKVNSKKRHKQEDTNIRRYRFRSDLC